MGIYVDEYVQLSCWVTKIHKGEKNNLLVDFLNRFDFLLALELAGYQDRYSNGWSKGPRV